MKRKHNYSYLLVTDFKEDPKLVSEILKVKPSSVGKKGELIENTKLKHKSNFWQFEIDLKNNDLEQTVLAISKKFFPMSSLRRKVNKCSIQICFVLKINEMKNGIPSINFRSEVLKMLSDNNCSIDIDIYE